MIDEEAEEVRLFVRNKAKEYVASFKPNTSLPFADHDSSTSGTAQIWWPEDLTVTDYTRDASLMDLGARISSDSIRTDAHRAVVLECTQRKEKAQGFIAYLVERRKIGVVQAGFGTTCFVFPMSLCAQLLKQASPSVDPSQSLILLRRGSGGQAKPSQPTSMVAKAEPCKEGKKPPSQAELIKALREDAQRRLKDFVQDDTATKLEFEPMGERGRFIVIEEVADFPGLVDHVEGQMIDDRHVVVYKEGHLPPELTTPLTEEFLAANQSGAAPSKPRSAKSSDRVAAKEEEEIRAVGLKKRDRRTVEEVYRDVLLAKKSKVQDTGVPE